MCMCMFSTSSGRTRRLGPDLFPGLLRLQNRMKFTRRALLPAVATSEGGVLFLLPGPLSRCADAEYSAVLIREAGLDRKKVFQ